MELWLWYPPQLCLLVVVVQSLSCGPLFVSPWTAACQASLSFTVSWSLFKLMSTESVMLSNHLILCCPLLLLLSVFPRIRIFSIESALLIRWPKELQLQHQSFPVSIQIWFPLGWTGLISLQSKGISRVFSRTTVLEHQFFSALLLLEPSELCSAGQI